LDHKEILINKHGSPGFASLVLQQTVSLICDGAITNMSESIMNQFGVGQDEFIFRMYSIALIAISGAAAANGDLREGLTFMSQPGTYAEQQSNVPLEERTWSTFGKIGVMIMFSSMGFFGSSCSAAITKNFGALTMSITSTARKATTLFLSFLLFDNQCTFEHIVGIVVFISALTTKSIRRKNKRRRSMPAKIRRMRSTDLELGSRQRTPAASFDSADMTSSLSSHKESARESRKNKSPAQTPKVRYHIV
jgi:hypothetical protein